MRWFKELIKERSVGCGPSFLPQWVVDKLFGWFYTASCTKHDSGYEKGGSELRRLECDWKFLVAMIKDTRNVPIILIPLAITQAILFFIIVRLFGWVRFNYRGFL